jgi:hypothetical protein
MQFSSDIHAALKRRAEKSPGAPAAAPFAFFNPFSWLGRVNRAAYLRFIMGTKSVDQSRCNCCGLCAKYCGSRAITLDPWPAFSDACCGCWGCYSICPQQAIAACIAPAWQYRGKAGYLDARSTDD